MAGFVIQGNALHIPLKDESVDCVVTSPPYWGLRKYEGPSLIWDADDRCQHEWRDANYRRRSSDGGSQARKQSTNPGSLGRERPIENAFCIRCRAWRGQLGLEPTFELYIKHLVSIFDEVKRVLKPTGTVWVVIGDTYAGGGRAGSPEYARRHTEFGKPFNMGRYQAPCPKTDIPSKSLCSIPARFQIAMIDRRWILRNENIWKKPNCMPESMKDRFTRDFEKVFFAAKSSTTQYWTNEKTAQLVTTHPPGTHGREGRDWEWRECPRCKGRGCKRCRQAGKVKHNLWSGHDYFFEQQFEPLAESTLADRRNETGRHTQGLVRGTKYENVNGHDKPSWYRSKVFVNSALGRNMRSVWDVPDTAEQLQQLLDIVEDLGGSELASAVAAEVLERTETKGSVWDITIRGSLEAHFAPYPPELCETPIKAGCPQLVCTKCGMPRVPIYNRDVSYHSGSGKSGRPPKGKWEGKEQEVSGDYDIRMGLKVSRKLKGYAQCSCGAEFRPGIVLDPFCGTGSTGEAAQRLGVDFIGLDLSGKYCDMSQKRLAALSLL